LRRALLMLALPLMGCSTPAQRVDSLASAAGFTRAVVRGDGFDHVVYANSRPPGPSLHVYIEGDGRAYLDRWTASPDPTPRRPLMLELMKSDPVRAIYVGRPCYFGLATVVPCTPLDWTLRRFSAPVVDSMASVVAAAAAGASAVEIYGHSGGGTLAVLLARLLPQVTRVVTLAGNLDPVAWNRLHGYTAFTDFVDPLVEGPLPARVSQVHAVGQKDRNVPPGMVEAAARKLGAADVRVVPDADHACCWERLWPALRDGVVGVPDGV
jgi:hypothetical protein